jgi:hypothetical protein
MSTISISHEAVPKEQLSHAAAEQAGVVGHVALLESTAPAPEWAPDQQAETEAAMQARLQLIGQHVPEVAEEAERITRGAAELIETFQVQPEFFNDSKRTAIFASLALSTAKMNEARDGGSANEQELERQRAFIGNATFLLTRKHATGFPDLAAKYKAEQGSGGNAGLKRVLDKYEQPELTHDLKEHIEREGILNDLREKLAAEKGATTEPKFHVLGIARDPLAYVDHEASGLTWNETRKWAEGLEARTKEFASQFPQGELAAGAEGFAIDFEGDPHHHVYIPLPGAELVMADNHDSKPSLFAVNVNNKIERVIGTIRHEYVHTKGSVNVGDAFGKSLEERRAEYHSGDTSEYYEVKAFFRQLQLLHGRYIGDMFDEVVEHQADENPISIYEVIARDFGLGTVAEIAAAHPHAYAMHTKSSITKTMLRSLGDFGDIIERAAHDDYVDQEKARNYTVRVVTNFRADKATEKGIDREYEEFIDSYLGPVLRGLSMRLADIPYTSPQPKSE